MVALAYFFVFISWTSIYLLTSKNIIGFYTFMTVNVFFFVYGFLSKQYFMCLSHIVGFGLNVRGVIQWSKY